MEPLAHDQARAAQTADALLRLAEAERRMGNANEDARKRASSGTVLGIAVSVMVVFGGIEEGRR